MSLERHMLADQFGRGVTGIHVSLTDQCNFDSVYYHNEGLGDTRGPMAPQDAEMTADDVVRILEIVSEVGVHTVKFIDGELMLRQDLEEIISRVPDEMEVSMTTNGTFLPGRAEALVDAGLERVNVSQEALDPGGLRRVGQEQCVRQSSRGHRSGAGRRLAPVKLDLVVFEPTAGYVPEMVDHVATNDGLQLTDYMLEIAGHPEWAIDIDPVHDWLEGRADRIEHREMHDRHRYFVRAEGDAGGESDNYTTGMVEIVDPVGNEIFCANCHRVRVTHDGQFKGCLNRHDDHR